jgi:hypothetical protein
MSDSMRRLLVTVVAVLLWAAQASGASGADACAKINSAIAALPSTGGTVDARGFTGTQSCARNPFNGVSKPVEVLFSAATFNTGASWALPNNVTLRGPITEEFIIHYTGAEVAADASGSSDCTLVHVRIETTNDAATGLKMGNGSQHCSLDHVFLAGTNASSNTGTGLLLDAQSPGAFSGHLAMNHFYVLGYRYGIKATGGGGTNTWTSFTCINCFVAGRAAGHIAGSIGIWLDANTNGTGSAFLGGSVEAFATGIQVDNGGGNGVEFVMDMEGNDTPYKLAASYNGTLKILNSNGKYEAQANGTANRWGGELWQNGIRYFDNRYNFAWTIYDDSSNEQEFQFNRGAGKTTGGSPTNKFNVHVGISSDTEPGRNYWALLGHKFSAGSAKPAAGTCVLGDVVFNTAATAGTNVGWICTGAGTPGTWSPWGSVSPAGCSGNSFSLGINAWGVVQCAQPAFSNLSGTATSAQLPATVVYTGQATVGLNLASSADPSVPVQGDVWINGSDFKFRGGSATQTVELQANKNAASGYAGLTASIKLNAAQGQKVWTLADLMDVTATTGAGSTVMLNEVPVLKSYTVESLPAAETVDRIAIVTDAASAGNCTAGGGNYRSLCRDTGSAWEPLGDGTGSGGSTAKATASNPDSPAQATAQTLSSGGTVVGVSVSAGPTASAPSNLSNVRSVGPGWYGTIQDALNSLPNATPPDVGGTIQVMPNYSEVLQSDISITTENTTIEFRGPAVLVMGTNSIQISPGLRNVVIRGPLPWGGHAGSGTPAVTLDYRGTGAAIEVGGSSALTENVVIENLHFSIGHAGTNALAINAAYLQRYQFNNIRVDGSATVPQVGIQVQGGRASGHWSGAGVISLPYILMHSPGSIGVQYNTLGNGPTNQNEIRGGNIFGAANSSGIGVNYAAASGRGGNATYSLNIEGYQQGVHYAIDNGNNAVFGGTLENNGVDIQFDAGANNNEVHGTDGGNGGILRATDSGTNNIVWSGGTIVSGFLTMPK